MSADGGSATRELLSGALSGDAAARKALVRALAPIVQVRVYRTICASGPRASGRSARQEVEDLTQDVLVALFKDDARVLRMWDAERGLSLPNFVGLVAEREARHVLQSRRRSPFSLVPTEDEALARAAGSAPGPETEVASRELFDRVWRALKDELTPRAVELFRRLVLEERTVEEVCEEFAMQPGAVYTWRSRLTARAREIVVEIERGTSEPAMLSQDPRETP